MLENGDITWSMCFNAAKQTAYFSLIRSFIKYGATVWDTYQLYNSVEIEKVQRRATRFVKRRYGRHSSFSEILDEVGWPPLSQRRHEARLILFYKIINGLAEVLFESVLIDTFKGTKSNHNKKFRHIRHSTSQYGQSFSHKTSSACNRLSFTEALSLP